MKKNTHTQKQLTKLSFRKKGADSIYCNEKKELSSTTMQFTRPEENENEEPKYEEVKCNVLITYFLFLFMYYSFQFSYYVYTSIAA